MATPSAVGVEFARLVRMAEQEIETVAEQVVCGVTRREVEHSQPDQLVMGEKTRIPAAVKLLCKEVVPLSGAVSSRPVQAESFFSSIQLSFAASTSFWASGSTPGRQDLESGRHPTPTCESRRRAL